jgi:hypothetical protein
MTERSYEEEDEAEDQEEGGSGKPKEEEVIPDSTLAAELQVSCVTCIMHGFLIHPQTFCKLIFSTA